MRALIQGLTFGAVLLAALPARASDLTVIVNVSDDGAAYYMSLPAADIQSVLGTDPDLLFSADGSVPIDDFRLNGSFELGDQVFERIEGRVEGEVAPFETMSMMVHPLNDPAPFQTPWDAVTATSVCIVDYVEDQLTPEWLRLYYGSYAHQVSGTSGLDLSFPETGRAPIEVTMHLYRDGDYLRREQAILPDGGTLSLSFDKATGFAALWWMAISLWLLILGAAVYAKRLRGRRTDPVPAP